MRFSRPRTASRLRSPISESTTATFLPCIARAVPRLAVVVVLPTPPFPDVIVITRLSIKNSVGKTVFYTYRRRFCCCLVYHEPSRPGEPRTCPATLQAERSLIVNGAVADRSSRFPRQSALAEYSPLRDAAAPQSPPVDARVDARCAIAPGPDARHRPVPARCRGSPRVPGHAARPRQ